jgi:hypothetical protein
MTRLEAEFAYSEKALEKIRCRLKLVSDENANLKFPFRTLLLCDNIC